MAKEQPTFEEALKRLEAITEQIEQGRIGLEESISKYEEGMKLVKYCRSVLEKAEQKIAQLQVTGEGEPKISPFEAPPGELDDLSHNT
ncbi:MAG: exodeoxyribonuclease VII small subunit [Planctomycetota bacterium]